MRNIQLNITFNCNRNCSYCYNKPFINKGREMSFSDYVLLLKWLKKNNEKSITLMGGEPLIHPDIRRFIYYAYKLGFKILVFSNGLFDARLIKFLANKISYISINFNRKESYSKEEYDHLMNNLSLLAEQKINTKFRLNVTNNLDSIRGVIGALRKFKIREVSIDYVAPNSRHSNDFFQPADFPLMKKKLIKFIKDLYGEKIKVRYANRVPICMLDPREKKFLLKHRLLVNNCGSGEETVMINPDLTVFPCAPLFIKGPKILELENFAQYKNYYKKIIDHLKWEVPLYEKCNDCDYSKRKKCQGSCLCYKLPKADKSLTLLYNNEEK